MSWSSLIIGYASIGVAVALGKGDAMLGYWAFGLLMQIPEIVEWRAIRLNQPQNEANAQLAFWLNILQPVAALVATSIHTKKLDPVSCVAVGIYLMSVFEKHEIHITRPDDSCPHMYYRWWSKYSPSKILYYISTLICLQTLPWNSFIHHATLFVVSAAISLLAVKPCGMASVWCWSVAFVALSSLLRNKQNMS
jgi:hypothetical protein